MSKDKQNKNTSVKTKSEPCSAAWSMFYAGCYE